MNKEELNKRRDEVEGRIDRMRLTSFYDAELEDQAYLNHYNMYSFFAGCTDVHIIRLATKHKKAESTIFGSYEYVKASQNNKAHKERIQSIIQGRLW